MQISLDNVSKNYSGRQVVQQVSLTVKQGEIVGLLGPNGAGKTTSFYMATGLIQPDSGLLVMEQTNVPKQLQIHRLRTLLEEFRLTKIADTMGIQVSGGERRRTEIARALAVGLEGPKFILLDEPFAGIDPIAVSEIQTIIKNLRDRNMGVLITDHNVRETLTITDRAYIMREGEVFADGSSRELANDPDVRKYYLGEKFHF